ncbi:ABC transporter ATP-binding protein [Chelatococcus sp. GCM10030263]|uniref:ABC transporter ATP-binding protein n=1 Tax=Chelatococcus sp. GCM10030263 TaxID=3273387 RepID=UPI00362240BF
MNLATDRRTAKSSSAGATLEVRRLTKRFGAFPSVNEVSWTAEAGEFIALLGSSGCGKSTSLLMIAGLLMPTSGEVLIGGSDVTTLPPERRNIGMVFQDYALFPHMSVLENVAFGLRMRRPSRADAAVLAERALERVGLAGLGGRTPAALSGGQRQRVALARALVYEPPVLLMDEPLGALDKQLREQMQHELRKLHRELGVTIIYVTHDQREALTMADRIAVMRAGRIEQIGTPPAVFSRPETRFVASFLGDCCFLRPTKVEAVGETSWHVHFGEWALPVRGPRALPNEPEVAIRPHEIRICAPDDAGSAVLPVTLLDVVFEGETFEYLVVTRDGQNLSVRVPAREHHDTERSPGAEMFISWPPDAAWLV